MERMVTVRQKDYLFTNNVRDNPEIRASFDRLAQETFGLSFEPWYQSGYWGGKYLPYALLSDGEVVANVSANVIDLVWNGRKKQYLQLGTVMTAETYRHQGLSRYLMDSVLKEWNEKYDAVFLFANDSVLDFYPKFGFVQVPQYRQTRKIHASGKAAVKLDMSCERDRNLLCDRFGLGNPFSSLGMVENQGLLMFYCTQFLKDCVYYCEEFNLAVIAEMEGDSLLCYDVFGPQGPALTDVLCAVASAVGSAPVGKAVLGFTPKERSSKDTELFQEEDTTLFMLPNKECALFQEENMMFPLLSHA